MLFFYQKYLFFCGSFVCWTYAVGGNNSKWSQPGEKPYNFCFPVCGQKCTMEREKVLIRAWIIWNDQNRNGKWNWRSFDHYFLAKLTLRCHIPPLLNVPPILTTNSDVERLIYMGESDVQKFLHFVWWCRAEIMITASYKRGERC